MKYKWILILIFSTLVLSNTPATNDADIGKYQLETVIYTSKKGTVYIVETVLDTRTGEVVKRRKKKASSYKLPYKDRYGKTITKE